MKRKVTLTVTVTDNGRLLDPDPDARLAGAVATAVRHAITRPGSPWRLHSDATVTVEATDG